MNIKNNTINEEPALFMNEEPALFAVEENQNIATSAENQDLAITSVSASEVADLRAMGLTNSEIAEILGIDEFDDSLIINDSSSDTGFNIDTSLDDDNFILPTNDDSDSILSWDSSTPTNNQFLTEESTIAHDIIVTDEVIESNVVEGNIILDDSVIEGNIILENDNIVKESIIESDDIIEENVIESDDIIEENVIESDDIIEESVIENDDIVEENVIERDDIIEESVIESDDIIEESVIESDDIVEESVIESDDIIEESVIESDDIVEESVIESDDIVETEESYDINDLKKMGFSDEEICAILEIDSLETYSEIDAVNDIQTIEEEVVNETEIQADSEEYTNVLPLDDDIFVDEEEQPTEVITDAIYEEVAKEDDVIEEEITKNSEQEVITEVVEEIAEEQLEEIIIDEPTATVAIDKNAVTARLLPYADNQFLTMPTHTLLELIELPQIIALPACEKFVYGLLAWQGKLIPVIDLPVFINPEISKEKEISTDSQINFVLIVAYQQASGTAHVAIKLDNQPTSVFVNNDMMCYLPDSAVINWQDYAISCFEYDNNPVPIVNPNLLFQDYS